MEKFLGKVISTVYTSGVTGVTDASGNKPSSDIKLTPFETDSLKIPESVITGASVNLSYAEQGASASLTFRSDPIGYEAYRKCMENSTNKVKIKFGYENGA